MPTSRRDERLRRMEDERLRQSNYLDARQKADEINRLKEQDRMKAQADRQKSLMDSKADITRLRNMYTGGSQWVNIPMAKKYGWKEGDGPIPEVALLKAQEAQKNSPEGMQASTQAARLAFDREKQGQDLKFKQAEYFSRIYPAQAKAAEALLEKASMEQDPTKRASIMATATEMMTPPKINFNFGNPQNQGMSRVAEGNENLKLIGQNLGGGLAPPPVTPAKQAAAMTAKGTVNAGPQATQNKSLSLIDQSMSGNMDAKEQAFRANAAKNWNAVNTLSFAGEGRPWLNRASDWINANVRPEIEQKYPGTPAENNKAKMAASFVRQPPTVNPRVPLPDGSGFQQPSNIIGDMINPTSPVHKWGGPGYRTLHGQPTFGGLGKPGTGLGAQAQTGYDNGAKSITDWLNQFYQKYLNRR